MKKYPNITKISGVDQYEETDDSITIYFNNGAIYLYDHEKPGMEDVIEMKRLAELGEGLNRYVNRRVKKNYAKKIK